MYVKRHSVKMMDVFIRINTRFCPQIFKFIHPRAWWEVEGKVGMKGEK